MKWLIALACGSLAACGPSQAQVAQVQKRAADAAAAKQQQATFAKAEEAGSRNMVDPASTTYRDLRLVTRKAAHGSTLSAVCGEVNSKNRLGGYEGYTPFVYVVDDRWAPGVDVETSKMLEAGDFLVASPVNERAIVDRASLRLAEIATDNAADVEDVCRSTGVVDDVDLLSHGNATTTIVVNMPRRMQFVEREQVSAN